MHIHQIKQYGKNEHAIAVIFYLDHIDGLITIHDNIIILARYNLTIINKIS